MPAKHFRHFALIGPPAEWVDSQVAEGDYTPDGNLLRTALRRLLRWQVDARCAGTGVSLSLKTATRA